MAEEQQKLYMKPVDEKHFLILGSETRKFKGNIKALGGRWNPKLQGWIFPTSAVDAAEILIAEISTGDIDPLVEEPKAKATILEDLNIRLAGLEKSMVALTVMCKEILNNTSV